MGRRWAAVVALIGLAMALATLADPLVFLADDSWFYLVIGRNIAEGHGITFSRVTPTNGFQPLWGALVATVLTVARAVGLTSPLAEVRSVLVVGWVLLGLALWRLDALLRRFSVPPAGIALACLGVLVFLGGVLGTAGSEANLVVLLVVLAVSSTATLVQERAFAPRRALVTGILLGLMVLGRLDTGFVAVAALGAVVLAGAAPVDQRLRSAVTAGFAAAAVVVPYLLWNQARFGELLPIAGSIKLDRRELWFNPESIGWVGWALLALVGALAVAAFAGRRPTRAEATAFLVPLAGGLTSSAIYFAWSPGKLTDLEWYRMPQLVAAAVAGGLVARRVAARSPRVLDVLAPAGVVLLVPLLLVFFVDRRLQGANHDFWHPVAEFSVEVGRLVPEGEVLATVDYPGVVAAYSGVRVLALDGLTADYAFQDDLRDRGSGCALADRDVRWLIVENSERLLPGPEGSPPGTYQVEMTSWLHRVSAGVVVLDRDTDLVLDDPGSDLSLWRIDPVCDE